MTLLMKNYAHDRLPVSRFLHLHALFVKIGRAVGHCVHVATKKGQPSYKFACHSPPLHSHSNSLARRGSGKNIFASQNIITSSIAGGQALFAGFSIASSISSGTYTTPSLLLGQNGENCSGGSGISDILILHQIAALIGFYEHNKVGQSHNRFSLQSNVHVF